MIIVQSPLEEIFSRWSKKIEPIIGKGHYSYGPSVTINKTPYATLELEDDSTLSTDLENNESSINLIIKVESFAKGQNASSEVKRISNISKQIFFDMGFRQMSGGKIDNYSDSTIKRVVSRYSRIYTGQLLGE